MCAVTLPLRPVLPVVALALLALGCDRRTAAPPSGRTAVPSSTTPAPANAARRQVEKEADGWIGVVLAREAVEVAGAFAGRLESVDVRVGDPVRRGDRIARIATDSQRQELAMAEASLAVGEAEVARTQAELTAAEERLARRLQSPELFSKEEIANGQLLRSTAESNVKTAQAHVQEHQAHIRQLTAILSQAEVRAPFDGTVALRYADPGTVVGADTPIVKLISPDNLLVRFAVPPDQAARLRTGQAVSVHIEELGLRERGTIERVSPEIDGASQMIVVEAHLDSDPALVSRLKTGLVAGVSPAGPEPRGEQGTP
jgi:RND family efflux transporter MFP subunit